MNKFVGCASAMLLGMAQSAYAVDFTFSFQGNSGIITGLADNTSNQKPITVQVTSSPAGGAIRTYYYSSGPGFSVSNGQILGTTTQTVYLSVPPSQSPDTAGIYGGQAGANQFLGYGLLLGLAGVGPFPATGYSMVCLTNVACYSSNSNVLVYTQVQQAAVPSPGPLPLLGASAAFGWSRRLRKRLSLKPF